MPRLPGTVGRPSGNAGRNTPSGGRSPSVGRPPKVSATRGTSFGDSESSGSSSETPGKPGSHSYTAPQWLLAEKQSKKFFSVPIPPVPPSTLKAAEKFISKHTPSRKSRKQTAKLMQQVRQLQQDRQIQRQKIKTHKDKVASFLKAKEEGIEEIQKAQEDQTEEILEELEKTMRAKHEKKFKEQEEEIKQEITEKFEKEFEETKKRRKDEAEKAEEESPPKKQKTEKSKLKSELLQEKIDKIPMELDKLTDAKSEMVWLLKQVIKAETKRKIEVMKKKKLAAAKGN